MRHTVLAVICLLSLCLAGMGGCVRRTLTIETQPAGALVFLNDEEVGRSPVTTDFTWYGDYEVIIRKQGYQTLNTNFVLKTPWYQVIPFDFFAEVLWPGHIVDAHTRHFEMAPQELPTREELIEHAAALKTRALFEAD